MSIQEARKKILDRIREARIHSDTRLKVKPEKPELVRDEYLPELDDLPELTFARNLVKVNGKFSYCSDSRELIESISQLFKEEKWSKAFCSEKDLQPLLDRAEIPHFHDPNKIPQVEVAFTGCEYLVARTGSVMVSSGQGSGRRLFGYSPVHIVIGRTSQLVEELSDALADMKEKYEQIPSQISLITGPSRTADIEKTLVLGAHGPRDFYVFLMNDQ